MMKRWPIVLAAVGCLAQNCAPADTSLLEQWDPASLIARVANGQGADILTPSRLTPELRSEESLHQTRMALALFKGVGKPVRFGPLLRETRGGITVFEQEVQFERESREIRFAFTRTQGDWLIAGFHVSAKLSAQAIPDSEPAVAPHSTRVLVVRSNSETAEWIRQAALGKAAPIPDQVTVERGVKYIFPIIVVGYTPTRGTLEALRVRYEVVDPAGNPMHVPIREGTIALIDPASPGVVANPEQLNMTFAKSLAAGSYVVKGIVEDTLRHVTSEASVTLLLR